LGGHRGRCPRAVIAERARSAGLDASTLYRWARAYRASGLLSSLLPYKPSGGRGKSRLDAGVEEIVKQTISEHFLTRQQRTVRSTSLEVARRCREAQLRAPDTNTVRVRIAAIPARERLGRRSHRKAAVDQFAPRPGVFDSAKRPLDLVQIDHTKLDIIVVDDEQRLPIGRPWITLAIDVYSRMVTGFYISLDPPGANRDGVVHRACDAAKRSLACKAWGRWAGDLRLEFISTTPRNSTARCCAGRASNTASCSNTGRWRNRTWVGISSGCWERSWARCTSSARCDVLEVQFLGPTRHTDRIAHLRRDCAAYFHSGAP
jgi:hypothetical protein